jgi:hypothetical protein
MLRFHISASFLKPAPGNHHGKWITVLTSHAHRSSPQLIRLTEWYQVEYTTFCLSYIYALKCRIREGNNWVIPWKHIKAIRNRQADLADHAKVDWLRTLWKEEWRFWRTNEGASGNLAESHTSFSTIVELLSLPSGDTDELWMAGLARKMHRARSSTSCRMGKGRTPISLRRVCMYFIVNKGKGFIVPPLTILSEPSIGAW